MSCHNMGHGLNEVVRKEVVDYHLCQDCVDHLEIQKFIDSPWNVEEWAKYDYHG